MPQLQFAGLGSTTHAEHDGGEDVKIHDLPLTPGFYSDLANMIDTGEINASAAEPIIRAALMRAYEAEETRYRTLKEITKLWLDEWKYKRVTGKTVTTVRDGNMADPRTFGGCSTAARALEFTARSKE